MISSGRWVFTTCSSTGMIDWMLQQHTQQGARSASENEVYYCSSSGMIDWMLQGQAAAAHASKTISFIGTFAR
jgi:hypothetical protein